MDMINVIVHGQVPLAIHRQVAKFQAPKGTIKPYYIYLVFYVVRQAAAHFSKIPKFCQTLSASPKK